MGFFSFKFNKNKYATIVDRKNVLEERAVYQVEEIKEKEIIERKLDNNISCPKCENIHTNAELSLNYKKCPSCNHYFNMSARERIELLIDDGTFVEREPEYSSINPLNFPDYTEKYIETRNKSDMVDAVIEGTGEINGIEVSIAVMDFAFMGGSMGSVVGEKIAMAIERGLKYRIPVVIVSTSGGARMQEGILSLMQMAKTSAAVEKLRLEGIPYIAVPVNPTTGGVTASFAMLGDVIVSEPDTRIGFAGPRVIEQTIRQKLPKNFQKSEFLQEHGMVDVISERENLKNTIYTLLSNFVEAGWNSKKI